MKLFIKKPTKNDVLLYAKNILLTIAGTAILAFGTAIFIIPFDIVAGGMSSIAIILSKIITFLSVEQLITIIIWTFFFMGFIVLGKDFAIKTLISAIVYPAAISVFGKLVSPNVLGGFFDIKNSVHNEIALLMAAVVGGALIGAGCAVTFLGGGSTGGTDIIAFTLCKFFKKWRSSVVIFIVDAAIIALGMFILNDFIISLLGIVCTLVCAIVIDKVFLGGSKAFVAQIITSNPDQITAEVIEKLERTTTIVDVTGGYTMENKKMVMVSFTMRQYVDLVSIVNRADGLAFVTVYSAHEIIGEDWTR
ncbi:MAG: YitT family protein [Oscillospiraceae bacterium]|nr:YitT family protein [Oscillospiraceae bacterium]